MRYGWSDTMVFGPIHWLMFLALVAVVLYPVGRILSRIGFSPLWSVLVFAPMVNLAALWVLAMVDWPNQKGR